MKLLESLEWRYATKKFDTSKKISEENLGKLKKAIQLSASSYGLQLYKVLVIEDQDTRAKLLPFAWNQPQITDASQLFVFCAYSDVTDGNIDEYLTLKASTQGLDVSALKGYGDFMKSSITGLPQEAKLAWTTKQVYIALGNLLAAAGELQIDACPMEGFDAEKFNEVLGLKEKGLSAAVLATVGYRSEEDETQHGKKVRKSIEDLFETI